MPLLSALLATALLPPPACPAGAAPRLAQEIELPRTLADGRRVGGFSALIHQPGARRLLLLSDLPAAELLSAPAGDRGLPAASGWNRAQALPLARGQALDGEGMVLADGRLWLASEGRRSPERRPQLLRLEAGSGALEAAFDLPEAWQAAEGRGLASNAGPESLTALPHPGAGLQLLMAAERPLLQDQPDRVRLLRWWWPADTDSRRDAPLAAEQGSLRLPPEPDWGLTDLLVLPAEPGRVPLLLALLRQSQPPLQWRNRLALYPLPQPGGVADPLRQWDLNALGLTPENWEGLALAPAGDGVGDPLGLLLLSDDNLNPLQSSRLALFTLPAPSLCTPDR